MNANRTMGILQLPRYLMAGLLLSGLLPDATLLYSDEPDKDQEGIEFFEKRIRPLLVDHCYKCHSDKAEKLEGNLRVDSREALLKGGNQGPAIEPGEPENSLLIKAVKYEMDDLKMPPRGRLEDEQIADLQKWIKLGAPYAKKPDKSSGRRSLHSQLDSASVRRQGYGIPDSQSVKTAKSRKTQRPAGG